MLRNLVATAVLAGVLVATGALAASAESPVDLGSAHVVDSAGALGGNTVAIEAERAARRVAGADGTR